MRPRGYSPRTIKRIISNQNAPQAPNAIQRIKGPNQGYSFPMQSSERDRAALYSPTRVVPLDVAPEADFSYITIVNA